MSWADAVVAQYANRRELAAQRRRERASLGGKKRAATMTAAEKLSLASMARIGGLARAKTMTPEFLHRLQVLGGRASQTRRTPEQRRAALEAANMALTYEQRVVNGRKGGMAVRRKV